MQLELHWRPAPLPTSLAGASVEIRPLSMGAYMRANAITAAALRSGGEMDATALLDLDLAGIARDVLPDHCRNLRGITMVEEDGTRREATVEDLPERGAFTGLCLNLLVALVGISRLSEDEVKNSNGASESSSTEAGSGAPSRPSPGSRSPTG